MSFPSTPSPVSTSFDESPARFKIGLIVLGTDLTTEQDFTRLRPCEDIGVYVNRVAYANPITRENLQAMQPKLEGAARLILPGERLDAIAYACTAASALIGDDTVRAALARARPGVPAITPTSAACKAFQMLGISSIALLAPYSKPVSEALANYFQSQGLHICSLHYCGLDDDRDIARLKPDFLMEAARAATPSNAQGLFLSCTALRAAPLILRLERALALPVVSSNQAMLWRTLRACGYTAKIPALGRLGAL